MGVSVERGSLVSGNVTNADAGQWSCWHPFQHETGIKQRTPLSSALLTLHTAPGWTTSPRKQNKPQKAENRPQAHLGWKCKINEQAGGTGTCLAMTAACSDQQHLSLCPGIPLWTHDLLMDSCGKYGPDDTVKSDHRKHYCTCLYPPQ